MSTADTKLAAKFYEALLDYDATKRKLPGVKANARRESFALQLVDSTRRTRYVATALKRDIGAFRSDPHDERFDPVLGAIIYIRAADVDNASWLAFLSVAFGRSVKSKWELCRAVHGQLGTKIWTWPEVSKHPLKLCDWINDNAEKIRKGPPPRAFGNHRKYETLRRSGNRGAPHTIYSYIEWILGAGGHKKLFEDTATQANKNPNLAFDILYHNMPVLSFGRLARFDYLSMLGKLGLTDIKAGSVYLTGSTGPIAGARLLFFDNIKAAVDSAALDQSLVDLANHLDVNMQDMEDAVCNWQKSPNVYKPFRG